MDSMKLFLNIIGSVFVCSMFVFEDFFVYFILVLVLGLLRDVDYYLEVMLMIVLFRNFRLRFWIVFINVVYFIVGMVFFRY